MHHLSCLSADKDYKNKNIHFYMVECDENMTKSCYASFLTFPLYYETNPISFLGSQMVEFSHLYELCGCKDLVKFNWRMNANYLEGEEENEYSIFL